MDLIDQKLIKKLQGNLPLTENPYEALGRIIGIPESEVIRRLKNLQAAGCLKRIGAILRHQKSGYSQNALAVFQVPANRLEETGNLLAQSSLVSHCYERTAYENWPYNLYAMFHSKEKREIENFIHDFATKQGLTVYDILFSLEELKKTSMAFYE
ncbi:MAG TPA: AsnC family transcriptional regulator [Desulfitobacteriaceae bacterium]|nr:AsnC family transcriptional regulator [Desulfitobacteriaceae bacterium]